MSNYTFNSNNPLYNSQQILNLYHIFNHPQNNQLLINKQFSLNYTLINTKTNIIHTNFHKHINSFLNIQPTPNNPNNINQTINQSLPLNQPTNNLNTPPSTPESPLTTPDSIHLHFKLFPQGGIILIL